MITNIHKIPVKLWRTFKSNHSREIFNSVLSRSLCNQAVITHPKMKKLPEEQWNTLCHNFSCLAAWAIERKPLAKGNTVITGKRKTTVK